MKGDELDYWDEDLIKVADKWWNDNVMRGSENDKVSSDSEKGDKPSWAGGKKERGGYAPPRKPKYLENRNLQPLDPDIC